MYDYFVDFNDLCIEAVIAANNNNNLRAFCWNIGCTTCGADNTVEALARMTGESHGTNNVFKNREILKKNSHIIQEKICQIDIRKMHQSYYKGPSYRDVNFLGYIGIALHWIRETEVRNRKITLSMLPRFIEYILEIKYNNFIETSSSLLTILRDRNEIIGINALNEIKKSLPYFES